MFSEYGSYRELEAQADVENVGQVFQSAQDKSECWNCGYAGYFLLRRHGQVRKPALLSLFLKPNLRI
jgi:hypothetical protein